MVHFNDVNHFFTSTWNPVTEEVLLYDSLMYPVNWQARLQLWRCYSEKDKDLRCRFMSVQNQKDGVSCAFFATKFAEELCEGKDPETGSFDKRDLRNWFIKSFENGALQQVNRRRGAKAPRVALDALTSVFFITPRDAIEYTENRDFTSYVKNVPVPVIIL